MIQFQSKLTKFSWPVPGWNEMWKASCVSLISCACQILIWLSMYQNMHIHNILEFDTRLDLKYSAEANWRSLAHFSCLLRSAGDTNILWVRNFIGYSMTGWCKKKVYSMANPVFGKSLCSDWFFLGLDFAVRTVSMETVQFLYFCLKARPANSKFATKTAKKKCEYCHSSHWNYQKKLKRLKFFRNVRDEHF